MLLEDKHLPPDLCEQSSCSQTTNTTADHYRVEIARYMISREVLLQNFISLFGIRHQLSTKTLPEGAEKTKINFDKN